MVTALGIALGFLLLVMAVRRFLLFVLVLIGLVYFGTATFAYTLLNTEHHAVGLGILCVQAGGLILLIIDELRGNEVQSDPAEGVDRPVTLKKKRSRP